ncbi:MAG: hypothetical protein M3134_08815 [Actinomycetota bacterium]|nr:hypothetical protein [Actinomycetota bacterium]
MEAGLAQLYRRVLDALDQAEVPRELREVGFASGLNLVASEVPRPTTPEQGGASIARESVVANSVRTETEFDALERIAGRLGLDVEEVGEIFHDDEGNLGIGVAPARLRRGQAAATKQIALLLAAGRQAGGYDDAYTRVSLIREMCRDFGRLDSSNFSSTITEMSEEFTFKGRGQDRQVHVTRPGWVKARDLITSLVREGGTSE